MRERERERERERGGGGGAGGLADLARASAKGFMESVREIFVARSVSSRCPFRVM